ncbi:VanZ family protein [Flavobacterium sp. HSC-61S13]|uniref:VanZ family protein n=1 Tax=Flavobacterium sp. HSC-61S13 TaxID=2910963 RepID=UPI00209F51D5|nr:VanZ family protein [Flavobacterium sp. HSC-61S13]MCP1996974.1 VanZ family protein [Flavobacterium sp. HSC-61S13]
MGRNIYFLIAIVWTILVGIACLIDASSIPTVSELNIPNKDKIVHFAFYFVFSILWSKYLLFDKKRKTSKIYLMVFVSASLFGITIELLQYYCTVSRGAEWADVAANCSGSFLGLLCVSVFTTKKK